MIGVMIELDREGAITGVRLIAQTESDLEVARGARGKS